MMLLPLILALLCWFCGVPTEQGMDLRPGKAHNSSLSVQGVSISPDSMVLNLGETAQATCQPRNNRGVVLANACAWRSLDSTIASVTVSDSQHAFVKALKSGKTGIRAGSGGKADTMVVWVSSAVPIVPQVTIAPGENWQAKVNNNPAGTTFRVLTGTHTNAAVTSNKNGNKFVGDNGAVMDGTNTTWFAFSGAVTNLLVQNIEIKNYTGSTSHIGAINAFDMVNPTFVNLNVHDNQWIGINLRGSFTVTGGTYHHNGQYGLSCYQGNNGTIDGAELAYNNLAGVTDPLWDAGGIKVSSSDSVVMRNVNSHHNNGPGLWYDINNTSSILENNNSHDNNYAGIFYEISMNGIIRNNTSVNNGVADPNHTGANILVSASRDVQVYGNTVSGHHGIIALQESRGNNSLGQVNQVVNLNVHDNTITVPNGKRSGLLDFIDVADGNAMVSSRNNQFNLNSYTITGNATPFYGGYGLGALTKAQWQALGKDVGSTFVGP